MPRSLRALARGRRTGFLLAARLWSARSGPFNGAIVNPDTGRPVLLEDDRLRRADFRKTKQSELVLPEEQPNPAKAHRAIFSALWQADGTKVLRYAPIDFIGRYLKGFFDYGVADEVHELKG